MKAIWNGVVVAESDDIVTVEGEHYFPQAALKSEYTSFSNHRSHCHWKGEAHYYSLFVDGEMNTDANDVCRRAFESNGLLRTRRCTPVSVRSQP